MKTLKFLIAVLISASIIGCRNQGKNSSDKQNLIPKSGELVFGDKKVTYSIEGEGIPCFVCADSEIQKGFISENLKKHFQFVFIEQKHSTYYDEPRDYSKITMDTIVDDIEMLRIKLGFDKVYVLGHSIMREYDIERTRIETPVFLSLSKFDFMVPEFMWDEYIENHKTFTIVRFKKSGHLPHAEEQELFDKQLLKWIKEN